MCSYGTGAVCIWLQALWCGQQLAEDGLKQEWLLDHIELGTALGLCCELDAAGGSPTGASVAWL